MAKPTTTVKPSIPTEVTEDLAVSRVRAGVLRRLGRPANLVDVQVVEVGFWRYHCNVRVFADVKADADLVIRTTKIAHSFFVATNEDGDVVNSSPAIRRLYGN